jgi:hypothetical protein
VEITILTGRRGGRLREYVVSGDETQENSAYPAGREA